MVRSRFATASPFDEDAYIFDELDARHAFEAATAPVCFYGHTHFAVVFRMVKDLLEIVGPPDGETALIIDPQSRYLVNPGRLGNRATATRAPPTPFTIPTRSSSI